MYNVSIGGSRLVKSLSILETKLYKFSHDIYNVVKSVIAFAINSD